MSNYVSFPCRVWYISKSYGLAACCMQHCIEASLLFFAYRPCRCLSSSRYCCAVALTLLGCYAAAALLFNNCCHTYHAVHWSICHIQMKGDTCRITMSSEGRDTFKRKVVPAALSCQYLHDCQLCPGPLLQSSLGFGSHSSA